MRTERRRPVQNLLQGQAGVWRVAAELALRGLHPLFPGVDYGYDLMVEPNIRVQVKAARLRLNSKVYTQGAYWFKFWQAPIVSGNNTIRRRGPQVFSEKCDFVILHGVDQNRYWIVPAQILDGKSLCVVGPDAVASDHPRGVTTGRFALVRQIRECEGRWDYLTGALATLAEAHAVAGPVSTPAAVGVEPTVISAV